MPKSHHRQQEPCRKTPSPSAAPTPDKNDPPGCCWLSVARGHSSYRLAGRPTTCLRGADAGVSLCGDTHRAVRMRHCQLVRSKKPASSRSPIQRCGSRSTSTGRRRSTEHFLPTTRYAFGGSSLNPNGGKKYLRRNEPYWIKRLESQFPHPLQHPNRRRLLLLAL